MASTYTGNNGIEKPATGDQSGTWGSTTNLNFDIIDRVLSGIGTITLSGTTHTLTTTDGTLSDGMFKVLVLGGSPSGTNTITISPNDQQKLYFVKNDSGQTATFTQGSGANVSVDNGKSKIIFADGAGTGAAVTDFSLNLATSGLTEVVQDTTPQLGGDLDANGNDINFGDNDKAQFGAGNDLQIYHNGTFSRIQDTGTGDFYIQGTDIIFTDGTGAEVYGTFTLNGAAEFRYDNSTKIATTSTGVEVTGTAIATTDTDTTNTGSVTLDFGANQNFVLTLTGNVTLANPTTEQVGQSGFIVFIQDATGGRTVSLGTDYETAGAAGLTLSTAASTTDIVPYVVAASGRILLGTPQLAFA